MDIERRTLLYERFDRVSDPVMVVLAIVSIPLMALPWIADVSAGQERAAASVDWLIWGVFAAELIVKTYLAPRRVNYVITHWYDVLIVVLPFLRVLRLLALAVKATAGAHEVFVRHGFHYALLAGLLIFVACAAAVTWLEKDAGGNINSFPEALWWAATTVTTVGYGDTFPTTPWGRGVGVVLMLVGIALFGLLTANISAFFVEAHERQHPAAEEATLVQVLAKLDTLEAEIRALRAGVAPADVRAEVGTPVER